MTTIRQINRPLKRGRYLVCLLAIFLLAGCEPRPPTFHEVDPSLVAKTTAAGAFSGAVVGGLLSTAIPGAPLTGPGAGAGAIAGAALGNAMSRQKLPPARIITDAGGQIINIGEDTMLVLPTDKFFYPDSTHMNESYYVVMDAVVKYINKLDIQTIKVAGYTDELGDPSRDIALSRQQAQNVAKYLQGRGVRVPFMYSIGYGEQFPIAFNEPGLHEPANNRVQITFRRLYYGS